MTRKMKTETRKKRKFLELQRSSELEKSQLKEVKGGRATKTTGSSNLSICWPTGTSTVSQGF